MFWLEVFLDAWWTFVLPLLCFCSLLANALNLLVLSRLRRFNRTYELIYSKTIINTTYLAICVWIFLDKCGQFCLNKSEQFIHWPFIIQLYKFYIYGLVANVLIHADLMIAILIAFKRLRALVTGKAIQANNRLPKRERCLSITSIIIIIIALSSSTYVPTLFFYRIVKKEIDYNTSTSHESPSVYTFRLEITNPDIYLWTDRICTIGLRTILMLVVIVLTNAANCMQWNSNMRIVGNARKSAMNGHRGEGRATVAVYRGSQRTKHNGSRFRQMLMYQSLVYVLGNACYLAASLLYPFLKGGRASPYFPLIPLTVNTLVFVALGLNTPIYIRFDRRFREEFKRIVHMRRYLRTVDRRSNEMIYT